MAVLTPVGRMGRETPRGSKALLNHRRRGRFDRDQVAE
jgi:hypothetical protein